VLDIRFSDAIMYVLASIQVLLIVLLLFFSLI